MPDSAEQGGSFWGIFVRIRSVEEAAALYNDSPKHASTDLVPARGILRTTAAGVRSEPPVTLERVARHVDPGSLLLQITTLSLHE